MSDLFRRVQCLTRLWLSGHRVSTSLRRSLSLGVEKGDDRRGEVGSCDEGPEGRVSIKISIFRCKGCNAGVLTLIVYWKGIE